MSADAGDSSWEFEEGEEIVPGRYALRRLGGGHRCEAYIAFDERMHALVVAKLLRPGLTAGLARDELAEEMEALVALAHPVIVRGFGAVLEGERPHLVLEYVEGPRLSTLIRRYGPLATEQVVPLAIQLCSAAHYMREAGYAHLDVKPSNVIMAPTPRLIDFSVAHPAASAAEIEHPIGTDAYMAPEQCDPGNLGPVGPAADVWAIGMTLHKAATGSRPFETPDPEARELEDRYPQLADEPGPADGVDAPLAKLVRSCLAYEPQQRPAPAELTDAFESLLGTPSRVRVRRS
jgi:serine/threonine protein kinase